MNTFRKTVFRSPTFWSGALAGCLVAVLALAGVSVMAQGGGDAPDAPAPQAAEPEQAAPQAVDPAAAPMFAQDSGAPRAATAVISPTVTYQGVLKDGSAAANGTFDFRFRLYDDAVAGTQTGEFLADGVAVQDGQFTVLLDFGAEVYAGQALWLEIAVRPAGGGSYETLSPRQPLTAAPLALSLPNVSTDPETGYVSIGGGEPISSYQFLGINNEIDDWVGMYITGGGPNSRPYYGYATDDEGGYDFAWTEYNGGDNEWQLHTTEGNVFGVANNGDVRQPSTADGLVKAAAYVECWPDPAFLTVYGSFNTITGAPVTAAVGPGVGQCYVDFGFNLTGRFFSATGVQAGDVRGVTCDVDAGNTNRLRCMRWRPNDAGAEGWGGRIMVIVY